MTRRAVPFSLGFICGLFAAFHLFANGTVGVFGALLIIGGALGLGVLAILFRPRFKARLMLFCAAFAIGAAYSAIYTTVRLIPLEKLDGQTVTITGKVADMNYYDAASAIIDGEINGIRGRALVYINGFDGDIGDEVTLIATAAKFENTPFFKSRDYYITDGILISALGARAADIKSGVPSLVDRIRAYSNEVSFQIRRNVGGEAGELLAAMVTGDRDTFSDSLRLKLNRAGIGHISAVSGLHVSIIVAAVYALCRKLKIPRLPRALLCEAAIAFFVLFSGLRVSVLRAGIMLTIAIGATVFRRRSDPLNTLCLCGFALTVFDPYAAADSSLLLSMAGVFGVAVMSPNVIKEFDIKSSVARALVTSLCASLATAPFVMMYFNELSLAAPLTNLVAVPICSFALVLGMIFALLGCAPTFIIRYAGFLVRGVIALSGAVSSVRLAYIPLGNRLIPVLGMAFAAACVVIYLGKKDRRITAFAAVFCACALLIFHGATALMNAEKLYLTVINASDRALVLRKGAECIIMDLSGGTSRKFETVAERQGIAYIRAAVLLDNAEAGYAAYSELPVQPDEFILPKGAYVFGGSVPYDFAAGEFAFEAFGAKITCSADEIKIHADGRDVTARLGVAEGGGMKISLLDGITVIDDGEIHAYRGDYLAEFEIGGS